MPDCGKILFLKLEKSECADHKSLFKYVLLYLRYSIPGLAFQFLSQFYIIKYDTRDIIRNFSLLHSLFVLYLFHLLTPSLKQMYFKRNHGYFISCCAALYVNNGMNVLCGGHAYCIVSQKYDFFLLVPVPFDFPNTDIFFSFFLVRGKEGMER